MTDQKFGFYFEAARRGATQGPIAPAEQFFEGSHAEESLVRETGQNSLDARAGADPVIMVFELAAMPTDDIPGIDALRSHIASSAEAAEGSQGHDRMVTATETANSDEVMVLRVSDYGTTGLRGTESINDPQSPLTALTRGAGVSADDGTRGGSFGIGSAVGPMSSDMCTVIYTSLSIDSTDVVFAGYSRLASHRDTDGTWRVGDGFYTDLSNEGDFRYLRNPMPVGPFTPRSELGTDIYILGYRKAAADPELTGVRQAFLQNFLTSIHRGHLIVVGRVGDSAWTLDAESLPGYAAEFPEVAAFYRALLDPSPVVTDLPRFGQVRLYINVDDTLERSLHTVTVRSPLMKIDTFRYTSIPIKYAAILECSDDKGNTLLRGLEPPQHHRWDPERGPDGKAALKELKAFARDSLRARVKDQIGDSVEVRGLAKYLPTAVLDEVGAGEPVGGIPANGDGVAEESATVQGAEGPPTPVFNAGRSSVRPRVQTSAGPEGTEPVEKGKDQGGDGSRLTPGGTLPGKGSEGSGKARIRAGAIRFRSWTDSSSNELCLAVTAGSATAGDLELVALGPGGAREDGYTLPISAAHIVEGGSSTPITHAGNTLKDLTLGAGTTTLIRLTLTSDHRYRLGVK